MKDKHIFATHTIFKAALIGWRLEKIIDKTSEIKKITWLSHFLEIAIIKVKIKNYLNNWYQWF